MPEKDVLLKVENLKMYFPAAKSLFGKTTSCVKAVDDVSFEVEKGKTFGLVGESGCGKTTTGKCILRITNPTEGHIYYKGKDISRASKEEIKSIRREIQLIFQDRSWRRGFFVFPYARFLSLDFTSQVYRQCEGIAMTIPNKNSFQREADVPMLHDSHPSLIFRRK